MEVGSLLTAWVVPLILVAGAVGIDWKRCHPDVHIADFVRADRFTAALLICCFGIWLVPLGWWLALPAGGIGLGIRAIASEDSREMWKDRYPARSTLVIAVIIGMFLSGFGAVTDPVGAPEWGTPLSTENPDAPDWPASSQHLYLRNDGTILVVNHVRMPGTLNPVGSAAAVLRILEESGMDEARLKQAIEELPGPESQADYFSLETKSSGQTHAYASATLPYTFKHVKVDLFGERTGAHMITVAEGQWGGEVRLLTIIKPVIPGMNPPFDHDPWAATEVDAWLAATP